MSDVKERGQWREDIVRLKCLADGTEAFLGVDEFFDLFFLEWKISCASAEVR
jgi:hypothetical protein